LSKILASHKYESSSSSASGIFEDIRIGKILTNPTLNHRSLGAKEAINYDLCVSIRQIGLLHPIIVRPKEDHFELIAGSRRFAACKSLGWQRILCHVVDQSDKEAYETSLVENIQRNTLEPIEEAYAFKKYILEFGWGGVSQLSKMISKSTSYVEKRLKLLSLSDDVIESVYAHEINPTTAIELANLKDHDQQSQLGKLIRERRLSSRKVHRLVMDYNGNEIDTRPLDNAFEFGLPSPADIMEGRDKRTLRAFDKAILTLRLASLKLADLIRSVEDDWLVHETFMQHKLMLDSQIDVFIKEKRKL
jgi:ParB family chromosome partitioning protein